MKKNILVLLVLILIFSLSSCNYKENLKAEMREEILKEISDSSTKSESDQSADYSSSKEASGKRRGDSLSGSGKGDDYSITPFTKILVKSNGRITVNLIYSNVFSEKVFLNGRDDIIKKATVSVDGDTLTIDLKHPTLDTLLTFGSDEIVDVYIGTETLTKINVEGGMIFKDNDILKSDSLDILVAGYLEMSSELHVENLNFNIGGAAEIDSVIKGGNIVYSIAGAADIELSGATETLNFNIAGAGNIELSGTTDTLSVGVAGVGKINSLDLLTKNSTIEGGGAIEASVYASEKLLVKITGVGDIGYKGDAVVENSSPFLTTIKKLD